MNKLIFILLAVLVSKIAQAQNIPYSNPFIEIRVLDSSQTQCVLNYCPPSNTYFKQYLTQDVSLGSWVSSNPKVISMFTYKLCLGRSDSSVYKAALYKRAWSFQSSPIILEQYVFAFQCLYHRTY